MKKHGLRGSLFEEMINKTIDDYRIKKLALIQKIPTPITPLKQGADGRITEAFYAKKSTVDYIGVVQEIAVCFDAKECDIDRFPMKNIHEHQYRFMSDFESQGGMAFILILFKNDMSVYYMRYSELKEYFEKVKSINKNDLDEKYFFSVKNKIRVDFLEKMQQDINDRE